LGRQWNDIHHAKVLVDTNEDQRCRGRPQIHHDDDSAGHYEAARNEFAAGGYAATSIEAVARRAVSTKTLYRLISEQGRLVEKHGVGPPVPLRRLSDRFGVQPSLGGFPRLAGRRGRSYLGEAEGPLVAQSGRSYANSIP
jgi:hypothetical protein